MIVSDGYPVGGGTGAHTLMLDLSTGATTDIGAADVRPMSQAFLVTTYGQNGTPNDLTAYGPDGSKLWSRSIQNGSLVLPAMIPGEIPGQLSSWVVNDTGELFVSNADTLTLIDQQTGSERWSIPTPACVKDSLYVSFALLDAQLDDFRFESSQHSCGVSHSTGTAVDVTPLPHEPYQKLFGLTHWYGYGYSADGSAPGRAYDYATGDTLWTRDRDWDGWSFDGGYLVSQHGNHIESIG